MNEKKAHALFMDYLYDELDSEQKKELELYLKHHPDMQDEFNELLETRNMLKNIPLEESTYQYVVIQPDKSQIGVWFDGLKQVFMPRSLYSGSVLAFISILLITLLFASVSRLQVMSNEAGWSVHFGSQPEIIQQGIDKETLNQILSAIRQENLMMVTSLVEESQLQNEIQLREAVTAILDYMDEQRSSDLQLVGRGLAEIEQENYYRYIRTNETLSELLQNISQ
jgi:hypothetical protein